MPAKTPNRRVPEVKKAKIPEPRSFIEFTIARFQRRKAARDHNESDSEACGETSGDVRKMAGTARSGGSRPIGRSARTATETQTHQTASCGSRGSRQGVRVHNSVQNLHGTTARAIRRPAATQRVHNFTISTSNICTGLPRGFTI